MDWHGQLSNCVVIRENGRSCRNDMDVGIFNSFVNVLVILKVRKVIVVKNGVYLRPIELVGFADPTIGVGEDTEIGVSSKHVLLEVFAPGTSGCFGCCHVLLSM